MNAFMTHILLSLLWRMRRKLEPALLLVLVSLCLLLCHLEMCQLLLHLLESVNV